MKHLGLLILIIAPLAAQEPDLREQLREALYTEEVQRNPEAAARQYESLLAGFGRQRALAATAVFRLAEVRRKQDRKDEAIALYERLLREFPDFETEGKLARENLAALGAAPAPAADPPPAVDPEEHELRRLREMAESSPDLVLLPHTLNHAIGTGRLRVIRYLLTEIKNPGDDVSLRFAVDNGNLSVCQLLLQHLKPSPTGAGRALKAAIDHQHLVILEALLDSGIDPDSPFKNDHSQTSNPLIHATGKGDQRAVNLLLERGADLNAMIDFRDEHYTRGTLGTALHEAVRTGNLQIVHFLLEKGAAPDLPTTRFGITPLHFAAASESKEALEMLKLLLEQKVDLKRRTTLDRKSTDSGGKVLVRQTPLGIALESDHGPLARMLVAAGARLEDGSDHLFTAIKGKNWDRLKLILEAGADPNVVLPQGTSPIANAIAVEAPECVRLLLETGKVTGLDDALRTAIGFKATEMVEILLEGGVDPNAGGPSNPPPLVQALDVDHRPILDLLLKHGADPNLPYGEVIWDLDQSADPFAIEQGITVTLPKTPLFTASGKAPHFPAFKALLAAGARPGAALGFIIASVSQWDEDGTTVAKLLEFRPERFDADHIPPMRFWTAPARRVFLEAAVYPALATPSSINFLFLHSGRTKPLVRKDDGVKLPSLLSLLGDHREFILKPGVTIGVTDTFWSDLVLIRKDDSGRWLVQELDLAGDAPLPDLNWGDLITAQPVFDHKIERSTILTRFEWALRKRTTFPVTATVDGTRRELTLKGRLLALDPTSNELPILSAGDLASYLWQAPYPGEIPRLHVERDGWGRIPLDPKDEGTREFQLQPGDHLHIEADEGFEERTAERRGTYVRLTIPGTPFSRHFGPVIANIPDGKGFGPRTAGASGYRLVDVPAAIPTLCQAIADAFARPLPTQLHDSPRLAEDIISLMVNQHLRLPELPPHPDFSRIRIRRLQSDGSESIIEVDLAAAIARCTPDTPAEVARKDDVALQPGDIIELPLPSGETPPWQGFTDAEQVFLKAVHSGSIRVFPEGKPPEKFDLHWNPVQLIETDSGRLPFAIASGRPSSRAYWLAKSAPWSSGASLTVERDGERFPRAISVDELFLRDGDNVYFNPNGARHVRPPVRHVEPAVRRVMPPVPGAEPSPGSVNP